MWIFLTRIIIFSVVWKIYLSILFLKFSLSVQSNRSWGHHLGVIPVSITQWHLEIEIFYTRFFRVSKSRSALLLYNYCTIAFYYVCCIAVTLFICVEVELNPGPNPKTINLHIIFHLVAWISRAFLLIIFLIYH